MHLLAQPPLGADAKAVAHDQHPDHQLRIDRRTTRVTVERCEVPAQFAQIEKLIYASKQMISGYLRLKIEGVEEPILTASLLTHHLDVSPSLFLRLGHRPSSTVQPSFSTQSGPEADIGRTLAGLGVWRYSSSSKPR